MKNFLNLLLFILPLVGKICHNIPPYAIGKRWRGGGNVPKPLAKAAYLGINLYSLEFWIMIKILFVCHGNNSCRTAPFWKSGSSGVRWKQPILDWLWPIGMMLFQKKNCWNNTFSEQICYALIKPDLSFKSVFCLDGFSIVYESWPCCCLFEAAGIYIVSRSHTDEMWKNLVCRGTRIPRKPKGYLHIIEIFTKKIILRMIAVYGGFTILWGNARLCSRNYNGFTRSSDKRQARYR